MAPKVARRRGGHFEEARSRTRGRSGTNPCTRGGASHWGADPWNGSQLLRQRLPVFWEGHRGAQRCIGALLHGEVDGYGPRSPVDVGVLQRGLATGCGERLRGMPRKKKKSRKKKMARTSTSDSGSKRKKKRRSKETEAAGEESPVRTSSSSTSSTAIEFEAVSRKVM